MVGWHHELNGHSLSNGEQGSLKCYSPWGHSLYAPFSEKHFLDQPTPTKLQTLSPITFPHVILLHSMDLNVNLYLFYWLAAYVYFLC